MTLVMGVIVELIPDNPNLQKKPRKAKPLGIRIFVWWERNGKRVITRCAIQSGLGTGHYLSPEGERSIFVATS